VTASGKISIKLGTTICTVEADNAKDAFRLLSEFSEIIQAQQCIKCKSRLRHVHRVAQSKFHYFEQRCTSPRCGWRLTYGDSDEHGLFPKGWEPPYEAQNEGQQTVDALKESGQIKTGAQVAAEKPKTPEQIYEQSSAYLFARESVADLGQARDHMRQSDSLTYEQKVTLHDVVYARWFALCQDVDEFRAMADALEKDEADGWINKDAATKHYRKINPRLEEML